MTFPARGFSRPAPRHETAAAWPRGRAAAGLAIVLAALAGLGMPVDGRAVEPVRPVHFEHDVVPILSRHSCNFSGCHGKAEGQNGFKLSVFGFDPQADHAALTKESRGRRVSTAAPEESLFLAKAAGLVPHGGGVRIPVGSPEFALLRDWVAQGAAFGDPDAPRVESIELEPREEVLAPGSERRLAVRARYTDGRVVDVTGLARFQSNNDSIAKVDDTGLVRVGDLAGQAAVMSSFAGAVDVFRILVPQPDPLPEAAPPAAANFIDEFVNARLAQLRIAPSPRGDDASFLRRVALDVIGTLPTAEEVRRFLEDQRPDKRVRLVESLLQRPEYADYWALKWADLLRVDRQALGHKAARDFHEWIRAGFAANKPLDVIARELLTVDGPLAERPEGAFFRVVAKPGDAASTVSQVFLGVRIACAECHHHPYDRWTQDDFYGMASYFTQVGTKRGTAGESLMIGTGAAATNPRTGRTIAAHPLGEAAESPEHASQADAEAAAPAVGDLRTELASWLAAADNPWFARNLANRAWAHFLGRGLVEPVDDVRATNPPSHPDLLDALAADLVASGFDHHRLIRTITSSEAYQRSTEPTASNERDEQNFSRALLRRLDAEVLLDAVCQATGIDEKFAGMPVGTRAVALWDSRTSHYFLELFGRPVRTTACSCERIVDPSVGQVLHLLNSPELHAKLEHDAGRLALLSGAVSAPDAVVEEVYLTFLSRFPTAAERAVAVGYLAAPGRDRRQAVQDLGWSLLNTIEFSFNH
jgi:hypothetical protein